MTLSETLTGTGLAELIRHGQEIDAAITNNDMTLLARSSSELERYFNQPVQQLPRQNAFSVAFTVFCFLIAFTLNMLFLLDAFPVRYPPVHAALFFIPALLFIIYIYVSSYLLSRGYNKGLLCYRYCFIVMTVMGAFQFLHRAISLFMTNNADGDGDLVMAIITLIALYLSRVLMNGRSFILFVLYCRTQRMAHQARRLRIRTMTK